MIELKGRGVLDAPLEPVIGLAEGETRCRSMTALLRGGVLTVRCATGFCARDVVRVPSHLHAQYRGNVA